MSYDYESALNSGVKEDTIANFLAKQQNFDIDGALKAGANVKDVMVFLSGKAQQETPTAPPTAPPPVGNQNLVSQILTPNAQIKPLFKTNEGDGLITSGLKAVGNIPTSALGLGKSIYQAFNHPLDTAKNLADITGGIGGEVGKLILNHTSLGQSFLKQANDFRIKSGQPELQKDASGKFTTEGISTEEVAKLEAVGSALKERYGGLEQIKKSIIEDPVGVAFDVATLATGGEGLLAKGSKIAETAGLVKTAETLAKGAEVLSKVEKVTNPLTAIPKVVTKAVKGAKDLIAPSSVSENITKVLTNTGKKTLGEVASNQAVEKAVNAFETIRQNAPNIKVTDINGVEKVFDPAKATFVELPQALKQTKDAVYKEYTNIAKEAGDAGVEFGKKDFKTLDATLEKYKGKEYTPAFSNKAKQFQEALDRFDGKATPEEMQGLIENVNLDVNPLSDKAGSQVANDFSATLRKTLDDKLEKSGNPAYQATRDKYAQLKSIEKDVITRYKEALREAGAKPDLIDHITSMDTLYGILRGDPTHIALGVGTKVLKATIGKLFGKEASLQRIFKGLGDDATKVGTTEKVAKVASDLKTSEGLVSHIRENGGISVDAKGKMPSTGYAVAPNKATEFRIPEAKFNAQAIDAYKAKFAKELAKPNAHFGAWLDGDTFVLDVSHVVKDLKTALEIAKKGKQDGIYDIANGKTLFTEDFLTSPKGRPQGRLGKELRAREKQAGIINEKKTSNNKINNESSLTREARKYASAEEFVKAQPVVYHGTNANLKQFNNKQGAFFADDFMNAEGYAGGHNVYEGVLDLKNPLVIDANGKMYNDLETRYGKSTKEVVGRVDSKKHDGVIFKNIKDSWIDDAEAQDPTTIYYAFRPKDSFLNESQLTDFYNKVKGKK